MRSSLVVAVGLAHRCVGGQAADHVQDLVAQTPLAAGRGGAERSMSTPSTANDAASSSSPACGGEPIVAFARTAGMGLHQLMDLLGFLGEVVAHQQPPRFCSTATR